MDVANFLSESSFWLPEHVTEPFSWVGHIPFAFWLVGSSKPEVVVELGTHSGNSYLAFCQSVAGHALDSRCFAVDTWQGDQHTGDYDESVFERLQEKMRDLLLTENDSLANTKAFLLGEIKAVQASRTWSLIHRLRSMQRAL